MKGRVAVRTFLHLFKFLQRFWLLIPLLVRWKPPFTCSTTTSSWCTPTPRYPLNILILTMVTILTKNYSQEAEGDEKAEVLVSFSSNQLVHNCQTHINQWINWTRWASLSSSWWRRSTSLPSLSWRFHTSLLLYCLSWRFHSSLLLVLEVSHITMSKWQSEIV